MMKTLNKIIFLLIMLITFSAGTAFAQDSLYVKPIDIEPGTGTIETLEFILNNSTAYYGFQANIKLPSGLEIETKADGKPEISLSDRAKDGNYQLISNLNNNKREVSIAAFSASDPQLPIEGNSGTLLTIKVKATSSYIGGDVEITNIRFVKDGDLDEPFNSSNSKMGVFPISVSLNEEELVYEEPGEATRLIPTFTPKETTNKNLTWESSDEEVASVDENGEVKILKGGTTIITATTENNKYATCIISVGQPVYEIGLNEYSKELYVDEEFLLIPTFDPDDAVNKMVKWTSEYENVATVDENGNVKAHSTGTTTITAKALGGKAKDGGEVKATCKVNVFPRPADSVVVIPDSAKLMVGQSKKLEFEILPAETSDKTVTWTSKNPSVATVDKDGNVTAISLGEAEISAMCGNVEGICNITVIPTPVESIALDKDAASLQVGETLTLTPTVLPENATDKSVTWTSDKPEIATVNADGIVTAMALGEATITAKCGQASATCLITVIPTPVESIALDKDAASLQVGETLTLTPTVLPENATDKSVTWTSDKPEIATVDADGIVTAMALGEATITAKCGDASATCLITVIPTPVESIALDKDAASLQVGETLTLTPTVLPENATYKSVTWTSDKPEIATVDADGIVTAMTLGEATITAKSGDASATCLITVIPTPVESIELDVESASLKVGETLTLTPTVLPENATDKSVAWTSDKPEIATVDADGIVTAMALGEATITAKCGEVSATCQITVIPTPVTGISLTNTELVMRVGKTSELSAIVHPDNATDKSVTWTSDDVSIASVDDKGIVTANAVGKATITVTSISNPEVKAFCYVTVENASDIVAVSGISISKTSLEMIVGDNYSLTATVTPDNASDKTVTWRSSDLSIAVVSQDGEVTATGVGTAQIFASSSNGLTAECLLTVGPRAPTGISLSNSELLMREGHTAELIAIVHPDNATDKSVVWATNDASIATVDQNGIVTAIKQGTAIVSATTSNGIKAECIVTVVTEITAVESISLDKTSLEMEIDETYTLIATITPENATDKTVTWKSSDKNIATVSDNGTVTAVSAGTATIYASSSNGPTAECAVKVNPGVIPVESISLSNTELLMREGYTSELLAIVRPDNATDKRVTWSSADESIATVDQNGIVTAIKQGNTIISATSVYNPAIKGDCYVTVVPEIIAVEAISLDKTSLEMEIDDTYTLIATITPDNATDKTVTWKSSDRTIATVSENGTVTAISAGTATIYASSSNGLTAECAVTVNPGVVPVESISLSNTELLMREGYTSELLAIVRPDNATDKRVTWSSADESIATVDQNGIVTAIKQGNTVITATSVYNPAIKGNCHLTVIPDFIAVEAISLNKTSLEMEIDDTYTLIATITPENATDKTVTWKSSDRTIATVSDNGTVTAVSAGTATIYASSSNGLTVECAVTVNPGEIPVESISLSNTELLMREGYTAELLAIVRPDNATDKRVTWSSADESIATVDQNGIVTAIKQGNTVITATSVYNPAIKGNCYVTVEKETMIVAVESISLNKTSLEMEIDDTYTLIATITPDDATDKTVTWKSSDRTIATVSDNGTVTAISAGTATIYASSSNGLTAECAVTVNPGVVPVEGISLSNTELLMREGYTAELLAIVRPDNATDKRVTWSSADESIATVDQNGIVTAIKQGNTVITATSVYNPAIKGECHLTVIPDFIAVEAISLNKTSLEMEIDDTYTLIATITPENATDKTVTWKSSDKNIATVSDNGTVTAVSAGMATIYASSSNSLTAECAVTVNPGVVPVESISLSNTELLMREGYISELLAIVRPDNATDKRVTWSSADESIATVDQNGIVTAIKQGNTIISATSVYNPAIKGDCYVTVVPEVIAVESISLNKTSLEMEIDDTYTLIATITPENATDKTVTWKSSDKNIATVSDNGTVTAISAGTATIYASSSNGLTAECAVTVNPGVIPVESISLSNTELLMREGYTSELLAIVRPDNATDKRVTWSSADESIATVDQNGIVTAIKQGNTIISATSVYNPAIKGDCYVTVVPVIVAVEEITVNPTELTLWEGETFSLNATVTPDDATDKTVTWRSSDRAVAIVSENGEVTAISAGTATIYASSSNGLTAECALTVERLIIEVNSITLTPGALNMYEGDTAELTATLNPEDATDQYITWKSSDLKIVTVENGVITARKAGSAVITATTANGKTASCDIEVYERPLTPSQFLRKGDGTTCTFIIMMDLSDEELAELGYRYVAGYTDSQGESTVIAETPLRYCHTSPEIFNDPTLDFWVFAIVENEKGQILNSNIRHLDGREEHCSDPSIYGYGTKSEITTISCDDRISITPQQLRISTNCAGNIKVSIHTMTGVTVFSKSYQGETTVNDVIDLHRFTPDTYLVTINIGERFISKKIVIR